MKIAIPRKFYEKPIFWIWFLIVFNNIYRSLIGFLHFSNVIVYLSDIACVILGFSLLKNRKSILFDAKSTGFICGFLLVETVIGYLLHLYNPLIYIWGLRTFFRYFIFFLACVKYLRTKDVKKILSFFGVLIFINAAFCVLEFALGFGWDNISGLYTAGRVVRGGAAGLNVLMCIYCTYVMIQFLYKQCSLIQMVLPIMLCMFMAALSEQKAFYFEFIIILVLANLFSRFSMKKLLVILGGVSAVFVGLALYMRYYGNMNDIFSIEAMMAYAGTDGSTYGQHLLNRTTALPFMLENFLHELVQKLFGLGLGYGDNVSFEFFSSGFFSKYNYLGYQYFFTSLEVVNIGILGLVLYYAFIISVLFYTRRKIKVMQEEMKVYFIFAEVVCALIIFFSVYNQSPILDFAAFNIYFSLAVPFVVAHEQS